MGRHNKQHRRARQRDRRQDRVHGGRPGAGPDAGQHDAHSSSRTGGGEDLGFSAAEALRGRPGSSQPRVGTEADSARVTLARIGVWRHDTRGMRKEVAADAAAHLRQDLSRPGHLRAVGRVAGAETRARIEEAWDRGWEPADLMRFRERAGISPDPLLLADAIADSLGRYAHATVSPRWHDQAEALGATVWWPASADGPTQRLADAGSVSEALTVLAGAVDTVDFLAILPTLERLDARPGQWRARASSDPRATPAPERMLERVRRLLAKAESTTFEAEADTFTAAAQSLMARHGIDRAMLEAGAPHRYGTAPAARRIGIDRPYEEPKATLLTIVADTNRCRTVWSRGFGFCTVIGFAGDLEATETIFTSLLVQATRAMTAHGSQTRWDGASSTRSFRKSFLLAYAHRVGERLQEATQEQIDAASAEASQAPDGSSPTNVLAVLDTRREQVDDALEAMFPTLQKGGRGSTIDAAGWDAGTRAADGAVLGGSGRLEAG